VAYRARRSRRFCDGRRPERKRSFRKRNRRVHERALGNPFFRTPGRANTRTRRTRFYRGRDASVCGVCLPVRKMAPVCSGNHTGEPVHSQDPLSARAFFSLDSLPSICVLVRLDSTTSHPRSFSVLLSLRPPVSRRMFLSVSDFNGPRTL